MLLTLKQLVNFYYEESMQMHTILKSINTENSEENSSKVFKHVHSIVVSCIDYTFIDWYKIIQGKEHSQLFAKRISFWHC